MRSIRPMKTDDISPISDEASSNSSLEEAIGTAIHNGSKYIVIDNLKANKKTTEFSSAWLESVLTANKTTVRITGDGQKSLDVSKVSMYATSNGIPMSLDLIRRALYISIRKQAADYEYKLSAQGVGNYMRENRPMIMSAIYTILKEYVERGSKKQQPEEVHRFNRTIPILNSIVQDIFGLPDITKGIKKRSEGKTDVGSIKAKKIIISLIEDNLDNTDLTAIGIFESLERTGNSGILGLPRDLEIYTDEDNENISADAKRLIGQKVSKIVSSILGPKGQGDTKIKVIEDYELTRHYKCNGATARYLVKRKEKEGE